MLPLVSKSLHILRQCGWARGVKDAGIMYAASQVSPCLLCFLGQLGLLRTDAKSLKVMYFLAPVTCSPVNTYSAGGGTAASPSPVMACIKW